MNYFGFYGLQPSFHLDLKSLRQLYYEKSKIYHPDSASDANSAEQDVAYYAALNNQIYKTLSNPLLRLQYILENEFPATEPCLKEADAAFLMNMMELHENLEEAIDSGNESNLLLAQHALENYEKSAFATTAPFLIRFDEGERNQEIKCMLQRYAEQIKYFDRLRQLIEAPDTLPEM